VVRKLRAAGCNSAEIGRCNFAQNIDLYSNCTQTRKINPESPYFQDFRGFVSLLI